MARRSSAIEIQISARVKAPKNGRALSERVIREAIALKSKTGEDVPGIELSIVAWRHGRNWNDAQNSDEEWSRFGRFLPGASLVINPPRKIRSRRS